MTENIPVVQETKKVDVVQKYVDELSAGWVRVLPKICTPERFARVAVTCIKKNSKLILALQTKEGKKSLAEAFMKCAELGIEPDGRRAYLIPYKNDIQLIIDYKGIAELAMRSGMISNIHADKVCDNDDFEYNIGEITTHRIHFRRPRGEAYAYYAIVTFKDGTKKCEVMSKDEVDAIRKRSKSPNNGPWVTDYDEMAKKTVFKRLSKWLPLSPELQKGIDIDNEEYEMPKQPQQGYVEADYEALPLDDEIPNFDEKTGEIIEEPEPEEPKAPEAPAEQPQQPQTMLF